MSESIWTMGTHVKLLVCILFANINIIECNIQLWSSLLRSKDAKLLCPEADICFTNRTLHMKRLKNQGRADLCCQGKQICKNNRLKGNASVYFTWVILYELPPKLTVLLLIWKDFFGFFKIIVRRESLSFTIWKCRLCYKYITRL